MSRSQRRATEQCNEYDTNFSLSKCFYRNACCALVLILIRVHAPGLAGKRPTEKRYQDMLEKASETNVDAWAIAKLSRKYAKETRTRGCWRGSWRHRSAGDPGTPRNPASRGAQAVAEVSSVPGRKSTHTWPSAWELTPPSSTSPQCNLAATLLLMKFTRCGVSMPYSVRRRSRPTQKKKSGKSILAATRLL